MFRCGLDMVICPHQLNVGLFMFLDTSLTSFKFKTINNIQRKKRSKIPVHKKHMFIESFFIVKKTMPPNSEREVTLKQKVLTPEERVYIPKKLPPRDYILLWPSIIIHGFLFVGFVVGLYKAFTSAKILTSIFGEFLSHWEKFGFLRCVFSVFGSPNRINWIFSRRPSSFQPQGV